MKMDLSLSLAGVLSFSKNKRQKEKKMSKEENLESYKREVLKSYEEVQKVISENLKIYREVAQHIKMINMALGPTGNEILRVLKEIKDNEIEKEKLIQSIQALASQKITPRKIS